MTRAPLRAAAIATLVAVGLTGCARIVAETTLHSDNTYSQHVIAAFNDDIRDQLAEQGGFNLDGLLDDAATDPAFTDLQDRYPGQIELVEYVSGDRTGIELTITDLPLDEYTAAAGQVTGAIGGDASVERVDDEFVVTLDTAGLPDIGELTGGAASIGLIESAIDFAIVFTFPGPVVSTTAGEVDGNAVRLGLSDVAGEEEVRIVGIAEDRINWAPIIRWGLIALAVIVVVGGATALVIQDRRRRRRNLPPPTDGDGTGIGTLGGAPEV